jgi:hypothetical protein
MKTTFLAVGIAGLHLHASVQAGAPTTYTAHEWGTFTSVQDADGQLIPWHPLVSSQLPGFVYDRKKAATLNQLSYVQGKDFYIALQRLETPVIYFYSEQPCQVDVAVRFPRGLITEWYPHADEVGPSWANEPQGKAPQLSSRQPVRDSLIRWPAVQVGAPSPSEPLLPSDSSGSHYYAARTTGANSIQIGVASGKGQKTEQEKFLFYRGLGDFTTPLTVTLSEGNVPRLELANQGRGNLGRLFVLEVKGDRAAFTANGPLAAESSASVALPQDPEFRPVGQAIDRLSTQMRAALEADGLYPAEAAAMVQTWRDSWFEEPGLRVLYLLPRSWTDEVLPISMVPSPREMVRVMVGRAEIITPEVQAEVRDKVVQYRRSDPKAKADAVDGFLALRLGRFAEPAIRLFVKANSGPELSNSAWQLLAASQRSGQSLAQK